MLSVDCLALKKFSLSRKGSIFGKVVEQNMSFDFSTTFVLNVFNSNKKWARYEYIVLNVEYPLFLSDFDETWIFTADF
jgi:hypothetical protein